MDNWRHKHIIDLADFSLSDYESVLELANRFKSLTKTGTKRLPSLQGKLITTLFFESSTRTKNSFELAAKRLSADVQSFSASTSSLSKGETPLDTAMSYTAMGTNILIVRHSSSNVPLQIANMIDNSGKETSVLNGGDGLHSHPSQALLDLFTLAKHFNQDSPTPETIKNKTILIVGDILHSRVARSNLWSLTGCGADVILCGPKSLLPDNFINFVSSPPPGTQKDLVSSRGKISIIRNLSEGISSADAIMTLRLQRERMEDNLITNIENYRNNFAITEEVIKRCKKNIPILHPGPVNRGIELSSTILDDYQYCLVNEQVCNSIPVRMSLLYLLANLK
tara:strand:+ start:9840 stop:10853 length:1014 start_codon:yes stop_codon:yes gene_type:complete